MTFALVPMMPTKAADTQMKVVPTISNALIGQEYTVFINVTDVTDLYAWEFQLTYDPLILDLTYNDTVLGGLNTPTHTFKDSTNEASGHLWWAVSTTYNTTSGISYGDHAIFEMHFKALATGTSDLVLSDTILADSNANSITHTTVDGEIGVGTLDLVVTAIEICNMYANETWTHSIYKDDTYANTSTFYYKVNVTVQNTGTSSAGSFNVTLKVYYDAGLESSGKMNVAGLAGSATEELTFTSVFHPTQTGNAGRYSLKATVDSDNAVSEDNELNNDKTKNDFVVTVMGDINGDKKVNILDGVKLSLAYTGTPGSTQWNDAVDLNHDNAVNLNDAIRISIHWGETW